MKTSHKAGGSNNTTKKSSGVVVFLFLENPALVCSFSPFFFFSFFSVKGREQNGKSLVEKKEELEEACMQLSGSIQLLDIESFIAWPRVAEATAASLEEEGKRENSSLSRVVSREAATAFQNITVSKLLCQRKENSVNEEKNWGEEGKKNGQSCSAPLNYAELSRVLQEFPSRIFDPSRSALLEL